MYFLHLAMSTVFQNSRIPFTNSSLVLGLTSLRWYFFNSCHKFSIGFKSGDSGGVFHQFMLFSVRKSLHRFEVCFGSLSCIRRWSSGQILSKKGSRVCSIMLTYKTASIIPSKMYIPVRPLRLIPAHTWTLTRCFALIYNRITHAWSLWVHVHVRYSYFKP